MHRRKSDAGTGDGRPRHAVEGLEDAGHILGRHPLAIVGDFEAGITLVGIEDADGALGLIGIGARDRVSVEADVTVCFRRDCLRSGGGQAAVTVAVGWLWRRSGNRQRQGSGGSAAGASYTGGGEGGGGSGDGQGGYCSTARGGAGGEGGAGAARADALLTASTSLGSARAPLPRRWQAQVGEQQHRRAVDGRRDVLAGEGRGAVSAVPWAACVRDRVAAGCCRGGALATDLGSARLRRHEALRGRALHAEGDR